MTLTEQFRNLEAEADKYLESILEEKTKNFPSDTSHVYSLSSKVCPEVKKWEVKKMLISPIYPIPLRPRIQKRANRKDVENMAKYLEALRKNPQLLLLFIYCKIGSYSTSFVYERDFIEKKDAAFSIEELQPEIDRRNEIYLANYAPRPGYTPCRFCNKQIPNDKIIMRHVFGRNFDATLPFCSNDCAISFQCGLEG